MLITTTALCGLPGAALANPAGGVVSAGSASIASSGTTLTVTQSSNKAVIDWRSFNIARNETTDFVQPSSSSIALNRVGDINPSVIAGSLDANGHIMVINPNGVIFSGTAKVDVAGITATTANIANSDFMAGNYNFSQPGSPTASVINQGSITIEQAGLASLVAPMVENDGVVTARLGKINLASGDTFTLDLAGDGKVQVAVSGNHLPVQAAINNGTLSANGGAVTITAAAARDLVNDLVVNTGVIQANAMNGTPGSVTLYAAGSNAVKNNVAANKGQTPGTSTVINSGIIDASGYGSGQTGGLPSEASAKGGSISILADNVGIMSGSFIDASGDAGGGTIKIGGDFHGAGTTPTAINTYVDANALIMANANTTGNGGSVAVWSDGNTWFSGNILAEGGRNSGNGGFVETSGHGYLDANGTVDLMALNGQKGTYLLDPANIYVYGNFTPAYTETINGDSSTLASNLKLWLDASDTSNVTLTYNSTGTTASGSSGASTITVGSNTGLVVGERVQIGGSSDSYAASVNDNSSDGVYTITNISGTTITLDANLGSTYAGATLYGGFVSQLTDKSGSANNATQATAANMPLWISNGQNGIGTMQGNGGQYLQTVSGLPTTSNSLFTSFQLSQNSSLEGILTTGGVPTENNPYILLQDNSGTLRFYNNTAYNTVGAMSTGTGYLFSAISNASIPQTTGYLSGVQEFQSTFNPANQNGHLYLLTGYASQMTGYLNNVVAYNTNLSANAQALVNQYQSAKWGIALTGPGNATGEAGLTGAEAQAAMASTQAGATTDGYSVFTTGYLNRLSQNSNLILDAGNNVTLDLQGDTLSLASGKSLTLTAGNQITTASTGTITTSNGAINLNATNGIDFANAFTLNSGGGAINFNNAVTLNAAVAVNSSGGAVNFASTVDGANNLTVNSGNAGSATFTGQVGSTTGLGALSVTAGGGINLNAVTATSISLNSSGGSGAIASNNSGILDATSGTITVNSGGDVDFSNIGQQTSNQAVNDTATGNAYLNAINSGTGSLTVSANNVYLYGGGLPSPANLVGYWNFNEGSGTTAIDDSGNGNTGTINGATYSTSVPAALGSGDSLSFNGTSGTYVSLATNNFPTGNTPFSMLTWVKTTGSGLTFMFGYGTASGNEDMALGLWNGEFYASTHATGFHSGISSLNTNQYHLVGITYAGNTVNLYVDGSYIKSLPVTMNLVGTGTAYVGQSESSFYYNGLIDDPRIYNTALSAQDIRNLYTGIPQWGVGTANITATNNITIDIMGTTLTAGAGKNITMTAGGSIVNSSIGTVNAGSGGNVTLKAATDIALSAIAINTSGGNIILDADAAGSGGAISLGNGSYATTLNSGGGSITLGGDEANPANIAAGTGYATGDASYPQGIYLNDATLSSGNGNIIMNGTAWSNNATANLDGILVYGGSVVQSSSGNITMNGQGGTGNVDGYNWSNDGIYIIGIGSQVSSAQGTIVLDGTGGAGSAVANDGVAVDNYAAIKSTGSGGGAATITVNGYGGSSTSSEAEGFGMGRYGAVSTVDGNITINSTGGYTPVSSVYNDALWFGGESAITSSGAGNIVLNAVLGTGDPSVGVYFQNVASPTLGGPTDTGNITISTDSITTIITPTIETSGTVTIKPNAAATTIGLASGAGTLGVTSSILANITAGEIDIGATGDSGLLTANAYTWGENAKLFSGTGGITINGAQNVGGNTFFAETAGASDITFGASGSVTSTASGTPITLVSGRNFINNNGSGALSASSGRWLVYSTNPSNDTDNSLSNSFRRFSCAYGGSCPSFPATGNGFLYSYTPTLTATPSALTITYGDAAPNLTGYGYSVSGYLGSDSGSDSVSGSLNGSTNYTQYANHGSYNINYSSGSLASTMGYGFSYANNTGGLTINAKGLAVTADSKSMNAGGTVPSLTYSYTGLVGSDASASFSGALATSGTSSSAAGSYPITIGTLAATGNYDIGTFNAGLLTINAAATPAISTADVARILQMPRLIIESQPMAEAPIEQLSEAISSSPSGVIAPAPASQGVAGNAGGSLPDHGRPGDKCGNSPCEAD